MKHQIQVLEQRNKLLEKDKVLLMEKCEASQARVNIHAIGERHAMKQAQVAENEAECMRKMYESIRDKFKELSSR